MGRVQDTSNVKMRGQLRSQSDGDGTPLSGKRRKTGQENEKASKEPDSAGGRAEQTPLKDRRIWTHDEEVVLVKVLLEHKRAGRVIPMQSKTAAYWTDLIALLYPADNGITQRRLYDKVRRMQQRYLELLEKKASYKNAREKSLFDIWGKLFVDEINKKKAVQEAEAEKRSNGNRIRLVEVSDSSEEEDDDHEEERVTSAKDTPKVGPSAQENSASEEEEDDEEVDEDDDAHETSPEKRRLVASGQNVTRAEATRVAQEELRKTASPPAEEPPKAGSKLGSNLSGRSENEKLSVERLSIVENGGKRSKGGAEQAWSEADMIRSLKAELFEYVQNLRNDCMRELDEVRGQLISPARLQLARRQQELILEELSLQEKELEISRRFCRLQKEALKLRNAS